MNAPDPPDRFMARFEGGSMDDTWADIGRADKSPITDGDDLPRTLMMGDEKYALQGYSQLPAGAEKYQPGGEFSGLVRGALYVLEPGDHPQPSLREYITGYLRAKGWELMEERHPQIAGPESFTPDTWWTRPEYDAWWRKPGDKEDGERNPRFVSFTDAIYEQMRAEENGGDYTA